MAHSLVHSCALFLLLALAACQASIGSGPSQVTSLPKAGPKAPDFTLLSAKGERAKLSQYRGKVVLINFWSTWCMPCLQEIDSLKRLREDLEQHDFEILGVSMDDSGNDLFNFLKKKQISYPVLLDRSMTVSRRYGVQVLPHSVIVDRQGRMVYFPDPKTGKRALSVLGAHEWDNPTTVAQLKSLIGEELM